MKKRIRHILHYRKPVFWATAGAVAGCAVLAVCFLTDPPSEETGGSGTASGQSWETESESAANADSEWSFTPTSGGMVPTTF